MDDTENVQSVGLTWWEMVAPVTATEVLAAIKGMANGAPGPDGRKLRELRQLSVDEFGRHFKTGGDGGRRS